MIHCHHFLRLGPWQTQTSLTRYLPPNLGDRSFFANPGPRRLWPDFDSFLRPLLAPAPFFRLVCPSRRDSFGLVSMRAGPLSIYTSDPLVSHAQVLAAMLEYKAFPRSLTLDLWLCFPVASSDLRFSSAAFPVFCVDETTDRLPSRLVFRH